MKTQRLSTEEYDNLLWKKVWEKAKNSAKKGKSDSRIIAELSEEIYVSESTMRRCIRKEKEIESGNQKENIEPDEDGKQPNKRALGTRKAFLKYTEYSSFKEFINEIDSKETKKGKAHLRIVEIVGDDVFLNKLYTLLSMSSFVSDGELFNTEDADLFFRFIKALKLTYSRESLFTTLSIVADRNSVIGKIAMKDYFIQLSYVTKTEIRARESLVRNETELNALKIRRSIENNQQLTKDYVINFSLQSIQNLLVLGNPGVGKSTFCRWICHEWSQNPTTTNSVIPVYIQLKALDFRTSENLIVDYIRKNYLIAGSPRGADLHGLLRKVHPFVCFILDGFDELQEPQKHRLLYELQQVSSNSKYILASRPYGIIKEYDFKSDQLIQLDGFDASNINNYIDVFMQRNAMARGKNREHLMEIINFNPTLTDFAHNPLMLSFIVYIYLSDDNADEILRRIQTRFDLQQVVISWMFIHNQPKVSISLDDQLISSIAQIANEMEFAKTSERTGNTSDSDMDAVLLPVSQLGIGQLTENDIGKYKFYFNSITFQEYFASISIADKMTSAALGYILQDSYFWNLAAMILGQIGSKSTSTIMGNLLATCEEELLAEERDYIYYKYVLLLSECRREYLNSKLSYSVLVTINRAMAQNVKTDLAGKKRNAGHLTYAFAECLQRIYNKMNNSHQNEFKDILLHDMKTSWENPDDPLRKWSATCMHHPMLVKYLNLNVDIAFTTRCLGLLTGALEEYKADPSDYSRLWDFPDFVVSILQNNPEQFFLLTRPYLEKLAPVLPHSFLNFRGRIELHFTNAKMALRRLTESIHLFNECDDTPTKLNLTTEIAVFVFILGKKNKELEGEKDISECKFQLSSAAKIISDYLKDRNQDYNIDYVDLPRPITQLTTEGLFESNNYPCAIDILASIDDEYLFFDQIIQTNLHNYYDGIIRDIPSYKDETNLGRICTMIYCIPALKNKIAFYRNKLYGLISSYIENNTEKFQGTTSLSKVDYFLRLLERLEQDVYENDRRFFIEKMIADNIAQLPYFKNTYLPRVIRMHLIIYSDTYWNFILSYLDENDENSIRLAISMFMNISIYQYATNITYIHKMLAFLTKIQNRPFYSTFMKSQAENILTIISNALVMLKQGNIVSNQALAQILPFTEAILKQALIINEIKENPEKKRQNAACNAAYILQYYFSNDSIFDLKIDYWQEFQKNSQNKALVEFVYPAFVHNGYLPEHEINRIKEVTGAKFVQELQNQRERMKVYQFPFVKEEFVSLCSN